jgi:hypothetical protein
MSSKKGEKNDKKRVNINTVTNWIILVVPKKQNKSVEVESCLRELVGVAFDDDSDGNDKLNACRMKKLRLSCFTENTLKQHVGKLPGHFLVYPTMVTTVSLSAVLDNLFEFHGKKTQGFGVSIAVSFVQCGSDCKNPACKTYSFGECYGNENCRCFYCFLFAFGDADSRILFVDFEGEERWAISNSGLQFVWGWVGAVFEGGV